MTDDALLLQKVRVATMRFAEPDLASVKRLDETLLDRRSGLLLVHPASLYASIPHEELVIWCNLRSYYGLPTTEQVEWTKDLIAGRRAIEIGSGYGTLGQALGMPCTDNYSRQFPDVRGHHAMRGQPTIIYPEFVERLNANKAVKKYKPQVVVASWVTQLYKGAASEPQQSYAHGVDEEDLLRRVKTYVHFGSETSHGEKRILARPHVRYRPDWLYSRAMYRDTNVTYIWGAPLSLMDSEGVCVLSPCQ